MRSWTRTAGLLFVAAAAACSAGELVSVPADSVAAPADSVAAPTGPVAAPANSAAAPVNSVAAVAPAPQRASADAADPFASTVTTPTDAPATQPSAAATTEPSAQTQGRSVSAPQVNVSDAGTVEIHVNDASLVEVLRMLSLQSQRNIIASKEVHGTVTANLYDVTVREALDAILHANGYDYREKGNFIYVYTAKELQEIEQAQRVKKTEIFRLFYSPAANVRALIMPVLSTDAQVALTTAARAGLASGTGASGGDDHAGDDMLIVTDYPDNIEKAKRIIHEVDRRPQQVLVEATILSASLNENNALGVDFTVLGGVDFSKLGTISGASSTAGGATGASGSGGTSGTTSGVTGPSASNGVNSALTGTIIDSANNTSGAGTAGGLASAVLNKGYVAGQFGGSGLNVGLISHDVGMFLQALETVTDTTVLANPKILVLNKQQGEVHIGQSLGYKTAISTETLTASSVSFLDTGIRLIFRPYIGDDGYIRLDIHPENSTGSIDVNGNPQKTTTEVTTNIMVRDGRTIVIGGLFEDSTTRARSQVPFLGDLPGLGTLFRQQSDSTVRQEIIILLTPHIIKDYDAYAAGSEEEVKYAERLEVGARQGLMPWGRERLAESWYELAVQEMNKPHPNRQLALWHLNCAINLNPMFSEAMELRARITGTEATATDDSTIRSFVRREVLADQATGTEEPRLQAVPADPPTTQPGAQPVQPAKFQSTASTGGETAKRTAVAVEPTTRPVVDSPTASVSDGTDSVSEPDADDAFDPSSDGEGK